MLSNSAEIPANKRLTVMVPNDSEARKFRPFLADSGNEIAFAAQ
jgi:hypothetical protein